MRPPYRFGTVSKTWNPTKSAASTKRRISSAQLTLVPTLHNADLKTFQDHAFKPAIPYLLPRGHFSCLPAVSKWFNLASAPSIRASLNTSYLAPYGATSVPLEATFVNEHGETQFSRTEAPLSTFLAYMDAASLQKTSGVTKNNSNTNIYLAQCALNTLPSSVLYDLPTPEIVSKAGRGDIYDSSIWIGNAPTYTPLHRDPNPNLFGQLCGRKVVRIFAPAVGAEIFAEARKRIGGDTGNQQLRGEEMMQGAEKKVLEELVWGDGALGDGKIALGLEAELDAGDGMFIPKGWWHSIKGVGDGVVGSVNWWFR